MSKRELTFVGLSEDGLHLIVADSKGSQYSVRLDPRLSTALSDPYRPAQLEIPLQPLSPKDIQARIRAGATAEEISAETGEDLERVRRFEGPPLADRAFAAEQARRCHVRGSSSPESTLDAIVGARLDERGVTTDAAHWDSWRREDGRWTVIVAFPAAGSVERVATWIYDPDARHVSPDDDEAERMVDPSAAETIRHLPQRRPAAVSSDPIASTVPAAPEVDGEAATPETDEVRMAEVIDIVEIESSADVIEVATAVSEPRSSDTPELDLDLAPETPKPAARKPKGRKGGIPSWDQILFGGKDDD